MLVHIIITDRVSQINRQNTIPIIYDTGMVFHCSVKMVNFDLSC